MAGWGNGEGKAAEGDFKAMGLNSSWYCKAKPRCGPSGSCAFM